MFKKIKQKVANISGIPKDTMLNLPLITIVGNTELSIENFKGIIECSEDIIRMNTGCGVLRIEGKNLLLRQITSEIANIKGIIKKAEFIQ